MYTIGEFSKIGSVSTKTLRYYDEIGLLHPARVDGDNHYRYYTEEQVDEILYIAELKSLDLRLEQIKAVVDNDDAALLKHFLTERIQQLDCQMQESIRLKMSIEKKIKDISLGGIKMENKELNVEAKSFDPVCVMSKRATINMNEMSVIIGNVFEDIYKNNLQPAGPVMAFYLDEDFNSEKANLEICVPVSTDKVDESIKGMKIINPGLCAMCTYIGEYSKLGKAYAAVIKWIEENNYKISSAPFDCYMSSPQEVRNANDMVTNVWFPICSK